jgi:Raf kinase inhibitor-like YbhB/YbcL family protein
MSQLTWAIAGMLCLCAVVGYGADPAKRLPIALGLESLRSEGSLMVESEGIVQQKPIPTKYSAYGNGISPPLKWSDVPPGTKSLALILEDPDAPRAEPFVHWLMYNIPPDTRSLPEGIPTDERLKQPPGALQGKNSRDAIGYFGPRPPQGDQPHHYHFQVFALDTQLDLPPGADRDALVKAMSGHVLSKGDLIGIYAGPVAGQ